MIFLFIIICNLHATEQQIEMKDEIRVALVGSSACQAYGNKDSRLIFGWGEVIQSYFNQNVKILNFAISGYSSKSFIEKGIWEKTIASKPHYIFITIGANDSKKGRCYTDPDTTYRANILKFITEARAIGAVPIIVTINQSMRRDDKTNTLHFFDEGKCFRKDREPYNQVLRQIAKEENLVCLELAKRQQIALEAMGEENAATLYRVFDLKTMKIDPSHTNPKGAEFIASIIIDELRKSTSSLKKYLK